MVINSQEQDPDRLGYLAEICLQFVWSSEQMSYGEHWSANTVLSTSYEFPTGYLLMAAPRMTDTINYHKSVVSSTMISSTSTCQFRLFSTHLTTSSVWASSASKWDDVQGLVKVKHVTATATSLLIQIASLSFAEDNHPDQGDHVNT